ncbi:hypothetical protein [Novipirellula rosea]|uniref:hypothetical protein n=1 Tax=Novipirellula rosea TaxID=1031540 RepID=UPI0031E510D8
MIDSDSTEWRAVKKTLPKTYFAIDLEAELIYDGKAIEYALLDQDDNVYLRWSISNSVEDISSGSYTKLVTRTYEVTYGGETKTLTNQKAYTSVDARWETWGHILVVREDTAAILPINWDDGMSSSVNTFEKPSDFYSATAAGDFDHVKHIEHTYPNPAYDPGDPGAEPETLNVYSRYAGYRSCVIPTRDLGDATNYRIAYRFTPGWSHATAGSVSNWPKLSFVARRIHQESITVTEEDPYAMCEDQPEVNAACEEITPHPVSFPFYAMPRWRFDDIELPITMVDDSTVDGILMQGDFPASRWKRVYKGQVDSLGAQAYNYLFMESQEHLTATRTIEDANNEFDLVFNGGDINDPANWSPIVTEIASPKPRRNAKATVWLYPSDSDPCEWDVEYEIELQMELAWTHKVLQSPGVYVDSDFHTNKQFRVSVSYQPGDTMGTVRPSSQKGDPHYHSGSNRRLAAVRFLAGSSGRSPITLPRWRSTPSDVVVDTSAPQFAEIVGGTFNPSNYIGDVAYFPVTFHFSHIEKRSGWNQMYAYWDVDYVALHKTHATTLIADTEAELWHP